MSHVIQSDCVYRLPYYVVRDFTVNSMVAITSLIPWIAGRREQQCEGATVDPRMTPKGAPSG